jgi:hypothetical protein
MTDEFIVAACVSRSSHGSGTLEDADAILAARHEVAASDIYAASVVGDPDAVRREVAYHAPDGWGDRALHHSLARDNALPLLEVLIDFGADPALGAPGREGASATAMAVGAGRTDAPDLFKQRGFPTDD